MEEKTTWLDLVNRCHHDSINMERMNLLKVRVDIDMSTNAGIVSDALKYVTQKTEQVNTLQKIEDRLEAIQEEEATTTNGIY